MTEFMCEHTYAAVLRFDGVITNPITGIANLDTTKIMGASSIRAISRIVRIPAMAPDRVHAQNATTYFFTHASMDRLEMVNVTIGFIEIAVAVVIVTIPLVKTFQVITDLGGRHSSGKHISIPGINRIIDEAPDCRASQIIIVGCSISWDGNPVCHITIDCIAIG